MYTGEREWTNNSKVTPETFGSGSEQAIGRRLSGTINMECVNGIVFPADLIVIAIDKAGADMDEVAVVNLTRRLEELVSGFYVEINELEPCDV